MQFEDIICIMLNYFGYEIINNKNNINNYIFAKKDENELWILVDISSGTNLLDDFIYFLNCRNGLYITLKNMNCDENKLVKLKRETGIIIWDFEKLVNIIGSFFVQTLDQKDLAYFIGLSLLKTMTYKKN